LKIASKKAVAIIPARGGSKRLPGKNKKLFHGKPVIQYSIEAAIQSGLFERVIVSTDSDEIKEIAIKCGAELPFVRPPHLSDDHTPLPSVLAHSIEWLQTHDKNEYKYACLILATAPMIRVADLVKGYELIQSHQKTCVVPVASFSYPIFRSLKMDKTGHLSMFWPEHEFSRSNDLPEAFHDVGQFYWVKSQEFLNRINNKTGSLLLPDSMGFPIPRYLVQDIDTPEDWERAEKMYPSIMASKS